MPVEKLHRTTPAPANRSPARVHLSECIAAHEAMLSRANAIKQAQRRLLDQKIAASNLVEETKAELEAVRRDERRLVADAAIAGEAFDTPAPIKTAMAAHEEARAALNHVMRAAALLDEEGRVVTDELGIAKFRRDEAVAAVIKSSPAIPKLLEAFDSREPAWQTTARHCSRSGLHDCRMAMRSVGKP